MGININHLQVILEEAELGGQTTQIIEYILFQINQMLDNKNLNITNIKKIPLFKKLHKKKLKEIISSANTFEKYVKTYADDNKTFSKFKLQSSNLQIDSFQQNTENAGRILISNFSNKISTEWIAIDKCSTDLQEGGVCDINYGFLTLCKLEDLEINIYQVHDEKQIQ